MRVHTELRAGQEVVLETGRLAQLAGGSCLAAQGGAQILATVVFGEALNSLLPRELLLDVSAPQTDPCT